MLKQWDDLPDFMKAPEIWPYWKLLNKKRWDLFLKRIFDLVAAVVLLVLLFFPMIVIALCIKIDSDGPVFYRQERVTRYGKHFRIHKFRTMISNADRIGSAITVKEDTRITRVGKKLRNLRLDELPQLFDIIEGNMSFVGTRPEVVKYVEQYKIEYNATLLMPAGITSESSIRYKNEAKLLDGTNNADNIYINQILPEKMKWNLDSIRHFNILRDFLTILRTVLAILGKDYSKGNKKGF